MTLHISRDMRRRGQDVLPGPGARPGIGLQRVRCARRVQGQGGRVVGEKADVRAVQQDGMRDASARRTAHHEEGAAQLAPHALAPREPSAVGAHQRIDARCLARIASGLRRVQARPERAQVAKRVVCTERWRCPGRHDRHAAPHTALPHELGVVVANERQATHVP